jgi:hypothetical protein
MELCCALPWLILRIVTGFLSVKRSSLLFSPLSQRALLDWFSLPSLPTMSGPPWNRAFYHRPFHVPWLSVLSYLSLKKRDNTMTNFFNKVKSLADTLKEKNSALFSAI